MRNMFDIALDASIDSQEIVDKLSRLIALGSVVEAGQTEAAVAEEIAKWCKEDNFHPILEMVSPGRPNLWLEIKGSRPGPTLLFEAHSDTVTAGDLDLWSYDPFVLTRQEDRLYGRGTADTKGNLVAAYLGIRAMVQATRGDFPGIIRFLVPIDEEGMMTGIRSYIAQGKVSDVDGAICCEPEDVQVCISQKGALRIRGEVYGRMAHGAMPLTGINPLPVLAKFLAAVEEEEKAEQVRIGFDRYLGWPSMTPTQVFAPISGPSGFNVVPASAGVSLDIRTVAGQSHDKLFSRLTDLFQRILSEANQDLGKGYGRMLRNHLGEDVEPGMVSGRLELLDDRPVTLTSAEDPLVTAVAAAVEHRLNRPAVYAGVPGATDGTWLWAAGVPIVTTGAGNRFVPHQADEWVSLSQLIDMTYIYAEAAYRFLNDHKTGR